MELFEVFLPEWEKGAGKTAADTAEKPANNYSNTKCKYKYKYKYKYRYQWENPRNIYTFNFKCDHWQIQISMVYKYKNIQSMYANKD